MLAAVLVVVIGTVVLAILAAGIIRRQRAHDAHLRELTAAHEHEWEQQLAVAEERARIAAEIHDVIALRLDTITRRASDPDAQRAIRVAAEEARGELTRLRDLLRVGDEPTLQPGLGELPQLVERVRAAGLPVTLHVDGEPRAVPASLDASAYLIVQAALDDVRREAEDTPTSVRVVWRRNLLGLQVRAAARIEGSDHLGLRERVELYGGELRAGVLPGGGYELVAKVPL